MSTHLPWFRSFLRFYALFCFDQISQQQHRVNIQPLLIRYAGMKGLVGYLVGTHNVDKICWYERVSRIPGWHTQWCGEVEVRTTWKTN